VGYELHITRRNHWSDEGCDITRDEWLTLVANDPELTIHPVLGDGYAIWNGPSEFEDPWLRWRRGNINTTRPDDALYAKMLDLAAKLGARVQGDEGEFYDFLAEWPGGPLQ
jgi:hypothetical protein